MFEPGTKMKKKKKQNKKERTFSHQCFILSYRGTLPLGVCATGSYRISLMSSPVNSQFCNRKLLNPSPTPSRVQEAKFYPPFPITIWVSSGLAKNSPQAANEEPSGIIYPISHHCLLFIASAREQNRPGKFAKCCNCDTRCLFGSVGR